MTLPSSEPHGQGQICWNAINIPKLSPLLPLILGKKPKCMVIKSMKPSATSVKKIMTPGLGDQALGWGQCGQIVKLH